MRLPHDPPKISACFDDPNLVSRAGLVPVMSLAERAGLAALAREHVRIAGPCGVNAEAKIGQRGRIGCRVAASFSSRHSAPPEDRFGGWRAGRAPAVRPGGSSGRGRSPSWGRTGVSVRLALGNGGCVRRLIELDTALAIPASPERHERRTWRGPARAAFPGAGAAQRDDAARSSARARASIASRTVSSACQTVHEA
jgi:hypothetical protein